jgi:hypothetical protein
MRAFKFLGALFAAGMMLGASKAEAGDTFASFTTSTVGNPSALGFQLHTVGSTSVLTNINSPGSFPVDFTYIAGFPGTFPNTAFTLNATSTALVSGRTQAGFDGFMEFRMAGSGVLLLRVDFQNASLEAGSAPSGQQGFIFSTNQVTYSSAVVAGFTPPNEFNINLLSVTPPFPSGDLTGTRLTFNGAAGSGDFSTGSRALLTGTPAPQSLVLLLTAIPALGIGGYFYRRRLTVASAALAA